MASQQAKLFLLAALLAKDGVISANGKALLKEVILARGAGLSGLLERFESREDDAALIESMREMVESKAHEVMEWLYAECPLEVAKSLSKADRQASTDKNLIYGEVDFWSFAGMLDAVLVKKRRYRRFYDLGSGSGRAVFIARLLWDFDECVGVEVLDRLHAAAEAVAATRYRPELLWHRDVRFVRDSFLEYEWWTDADVVFANSTCFEDDLMLQLSSLATNLDPGAVFITFTKGLPDPHDAFDLVFRKRFKQSWGPATVFVHVRKFPDGSSHPLVRNFHTVDQPDDLRLFDDLHDPPSRHARQDQDEPPHHRDAPDDDPLQALAADDDFSHLQPLINDLD